MTWDIKSILTMMLGFFGGLLIILSWANFCSYLAMKTGILYYLKSDGNTTENYIKQKLKFWNIFIRNLFGGIGIKIAIKRYRQKKWRTLKTA